MPQAPGSLSRGGFSPAEIAKAWRDEHRGMFDDIPDGDLIRALQTEDPDTYALIDPLLEGAESLPAQPTFSSPSAGQARGFASGSLTPPPVSPSTFDTVATTGLRIVPAIGGAIGGSILAPGLGTAAGGAAGSAAGETAAQYYEKTFGQREAISPGTIALEAGLGALNPAARGASTLARIGSQAAFGAGLGGTGTVGRSLIETGALPSGREVATGVGLGAAFGGATHAGFEGAGAAVRAGQRAVGFIDDLSGALPGAGGMGVPMRAEGPSLPGGPTPSAFVGGPPPPPGPMMAPLGRADYDVLTPAIEAQYHAEEAQLTSRLQQVFGPDARPSHGSDLHTATEAKSYLEQIAANRVSMEQIGAVRGAVESSLDLGPLPASPPPQGLLPPGDFSDPNLTDLVGYRPPAPPLEDQLGGRLEASLGQPPGPPRLNRPPDGNFRLTREDVPRGKAELAQGDLLPPPRHPPWFASPIRQSGEVGGVPSSRTEPHLPGISSPGVDRPFPSGPNAGPRREGEAHGAPRKVARMIPSGNTTRKEFHKSALHAEDPGTYPPEVRRELAAMAYELDTYRHEQLSGGITKAQIQDVMDQENVDISTAIAMLKKSGATSGGAVAGSPVYHDIRKAAEGSFGSNVTRANMLKFIRASLLEGRGNGLTDAAAQVARGRIAQRARGGRTPEGEKAGSFTNQSIPSVTKGRVRRVGYSIIAPEDAGDSIIGWADPSGARALADQDLSPDQRVVREMDDGEVWNAIQTWRTIGREGLPEGSIPLYEAAIEDGVRRGLIEPEQLPLLMEGPGGAKGPSLFDFEGGEETGAPPRPSTPESQPSLPGTEGVRDQNIPTPEVADLPFSLTAPKAGPPSAAESRAKLAAQRKGGLFEHLMGEEGVLLPPPPAGDRAGLKKWLKSNDAEHGGEAWFSRVEQAIEDGEWDRAWKTAAAASSKAYANAFMRAHTPAQQAAIARAVRGTALQDDLATQSITLGRRASGLGTAPPVKDFPPSTRIGQTVKGAQIGPAGILNLGEPQQRTPIGSRAMTLDKEIMDSFVDAIEEHPDLVHLVRGNRDAALRLGRQITDLVASGQIRFDYANFPGMTRYEVGRQYRNTLSEAGRILGRHGNFVQQFDAEVHEWADRLDMGAARAGSLGEGTGRPPTIRGPRGQPLTEGASAVLDRITQDLNLPAADRAAMLNDLRDKHPQSLGQAAMNTQYAFLTSGLPTAIRNAISYGQRYTVEMFDDLITAGAGRVLGGREGAVGRFAGARARERASALVSGRRGGLPGPGSVRRGLAETFEDIYNLTPTILREGARPNDVRQSMRIFSSYPAEAAHLLGAVMGEEIPIAASKSSILNALGSPRVQRWLQIWNRAQEFPLRALAADTNFRAQLRAKGFNPAEVLADPDLGRLAERVGGGQALERMLFRAAADAREMTYSGGFAKNSIPGWAVHMVQQAWPAKLAVRFPAFNFARAPRWIYDHGPWALADLIRLPFDQKGWTSTGRFTGGGRLYRGLKAQAYETDVIPLLRGDITEAEGHVGDALSELQSTSQEWANRQRQVTRLEARAQEGLPDTPTALSEATEMRDQLARRRERLQGTLREANRTVTQLQHKEAALWKEVQNATGISAPTYASWFGRMASGTTAMLGAAVLMRSSEYADGTRYDQLRIPREGQDSWNIDFSAFAPVPQFMFVADVMVDFERHTDWAAVLKEIGEGFSPPALAASAGFGAAIGGQAGLGGAVAGAVLGGSAEEVLKWNRAIWKHYDGKYTPDALGADFGRAFLSMSRMAGTALTIADLMTRNGWPGLQDVADAAVGTIGQFLAGYATPTGQVKDLAGQFSEEESKIRSVPRTSATDPASWSYPLAQPLSRVPFANRLLPEVTSQTSGKPLRSEYPAMRVLTGIGGAPSDFVQEEVRRLGVAGSTLYIKETGDVEIDRLNAQHYAALLTEHLPQILEHPSYQALAKSPAAQRDFLQTSIFPAFKAAARAQTRASIDPTRYEGATVTGEAARKQERQRRLLDQLDQVEGTGEETSDSGDPNAPPSAPPGVSGSLPGPAVSGAPPPSPF